jgi:aminodeoxychorismate lyase
MKASINGRLFDADSAGPVSPVDRGLLYGDGLFETLRVRDGRIELLPGHRERLYRSIEALGLPFSWDASRTASALEEVVRANGGGNLALRLTVTRGIGGTRLDTDGCSQASILITASSYPQEATKLAADGLHLASCPFPRNEKSPLARHKTLNYLEPILARGFARRRGANEALFLNTQGRVAEAGAANIFLVRDGSLVTPSIEEGALPGIVREVVIRLAGEQDLPVEERPVEAGEFLSAAEVFITNSLIGLAPVVRIDGEALPGSGSPPILPALTSGFDEVAKGRRTPD